jgi:selenocysteine lyase/cysteine desulfurase
VLIARLRAAGSRGWTAPGVCLDYTGSALYPASLVRRHARLAADRVLASPRSGPRASGRDRNRASLTLEQFDADPAVYDVVFTANASGAIQLLAEAFPFAAGSRLVLTADNHNSINGLRVAAQRRRGPSSTFAGRRVAGADPDHR